MTASRLTWGFARDGGLPFSNYLMHVDTYWEIPARALWFQGAIISLVGGRSILVHRGHCYCSGQRLHDRFDNIILTVHICGYYFWNVQYSTSNILSWTLASCY